MQTEPLDTLENVVCTLRPAERLRGVIAACRVAEQRRFEFPNTAVNAAAQLPLSQQ